MKTNTSSRGRHCMAIASIILIVAGMITGMTGCPHLMPSRNLEIRTWYDLDQVRHNLSGHHRLMNNLDSTTPGYDELAGPTADGGKGWKPIGEPDTPGPGFPFRGTFDGQGYHISDLFIYRYNKAQVGLFTVLASPEAVIENLGVVNARVVGRYYVGGLVGTNDRGTVRDCYVSGTVFGERGGMVIGLTGGLYVGGLVGENSGTVINSHFSGDVTGGSYVGGLVGANFDGAVNASYSSGNVTCHNTEAGGLVGRSTGTIRDCYTTSSVVGDEYVGGLVGFNARAIHDCYSTGRVIGKSQVGGLVGFNSDLSTVHNSFWDAETSMRDYSDGGTAKNTLAMRNIATYADTATEGLQEPWEISAVAPGRTDETHIWNIVDGVTYPFFSWQE